MPALRLFRDGSRLEYGKGHLDQWSVYLVRLHEAKIVVGEAQHLAWLAELAQQHSAKQLYEDYTIVYNRSSNQLHSYMFDLIHTMARAYDRQSLKAEVTLAAIYAGLVACERRQRSRPGARRTLRLAVHLVLAEGQPAPTATALLKGQSSAQLAAACAARGF